MVVKLSIDVMKRTLKAFVISFAVNSGVYVSRALSPHNLAGNNNSGNYLQPDFNFPLCARNKFSSPQHSPFLQWYLRKETLRPHVEEEVTPAKVGLTVAGALWTVQKKEILLHNRGGYGCTKPLQEYTMDISQPRWPGERRQGAGRRYY